MQLRTLVGAFESDHALLRAARAARAAGLGVRDAYTPFPIHGMDEALGLPPSWMPKACLGFGLLGATVALGFQYWVSVFDWPMNIGGKPFDASPALVPVAFELTVLVAGLGTVATFLRFRRLWPGKRPALKELGATDDRFLLVLREGPDGAGADRLKSFLKEHGASRVDELRGEP